MVGEDGVEVNFKWLSGFDDVVIGGGIIGLYVSWWLLHHTKKSVCILEKNEVGGLLNPLSYGSFKDLLKISITDGEALKWLKKFGKFEKAENTYYDKIFEERPGNKYYPKEGWPSILVKIIEDLKSFPRFAICNESPIIEDWLQEIIFTIPGNLWLTTPDPLHHKECKAEIVSKPDGTDLLVPKMDDDILSLSEDEAYPTTYRIYDNQTLLKMNRVIQVGSAVKFSDLETAFNDANLKLSSKMLA